MVLGKRTDYGDAKYAGVQVPFTQDVPGTVEGYGLCGFDFIVAPLVRDGWRPPEPAVPENGSLPSPFKRDDCLYINSSQWANQVVGLVSEWIEPDCPDPAVRQRSVAALRHQLGWAAHLGLQAVVLPPPHRPAQCPNYAQVLNQALQGLTHMALWLTVPLVLEQDTREGTAAGGAGAAAEAQNGGGSATSPVGPSAFDGWEAWHQIRALCDHHNLLGACLRVGPVLPSAASLGRWCGEPVKAVLLPTSVFTANKRGYPVLSKAHQDLVATFFKMGVQMVLEGEACHAVPPPAAAAAAPPGAKQLTPTPPSAAAATAAAAVGPDGEPLGFTITNPGEAHPLRPYWEYLCFLFRRLETVSEQERQEASYRDYLQVPLQPLQDNLESQTYETFEKDVQKYKLYEEAVYKALKERHCARSAAADDAEASPYDLPLASTSGRGGGGGGATRGSVGPAGRSVVLMVVGAGRGPLVRASMRAAARADVRLRVYAVEKNPNAIVHIQQMLRTEGWENDVTIVSADMRHWQAPEPAEILVSELLGSFGDNELSPECLDGAQRFLAPGGISIPVSYTSYLAPATSHKLHHDVKAYKDLEHFETPYVVRLHRHYLLADTQPLFTFVHPNTDAPIDNSRYASVTFPRDPAAGAAVLHGFAGYFECTLYGDVLLSIHPPSHSDNMFSWFPIFFPLREPVYVPAGAPVVMQMWRCCSPHKVWYEWAVTEPVAGPIHNVGGRSYWVGM